MLCTVAEHWTKFSKFSTNLPAASGLIENEIPAGQGMIVVDKKTS